jgi:hypothetical protein
LMLSNVIVDFFKIFFFPFSCMQSKKVFVFFSAVPVLTEEQLSHLL